ncbi:MAG: hypothetical protein WC785_00870 [Tatlockia sp.]|jgi:hypothetical protein
MNANERANMLSFIPEETNQLIVRSFHSQTWKDLLSHWQKTEPADNFQRLCINLFFVALCFPLEKTSLLTELWSTLEESLTVFFKNALINAIPVALIKPVFNQQNAQPFAFFNEPVNRTSNFYQTPYHPADAAQCIRLIVGSGLSKFISKLISQDNIDWLLLSDNRTIEEVMKSKYSDFRNNLAKPLFNNKTRSPLLSLVIKETRHRRLKTIQNILNVAKLNIDAVFSFLTDIKANKLLSPQEFRKIVPSQKQVTVSDGDVRIVHLTHGKGYNSVLKKRLAQPGFFSPDPQQTKIEQQNNTTILFSETEINSVVIRLMQFVYEQVKDWPKNENLQAFCELMTDKALLNALKHTTPEQNIIDIDSNTALYEKLPAIIALFNSNLSLPDYPAQDEPTAPAMYLALCYKQLDKIFNQLESQRPAFAPATL